LITPLCQAPTRKTVRSEVSARKWVKSARFMPAIPYVGNKSEVQSLKSKVELARELGIKLPGILETGLVGSLFVLAVDVCYGEDSAAVWELRFGFEPLGAEASWDELELVCKDRFVTGGFPDD